MDLTSHQKNFYLKFLPTRYLTIEEDNLMKSHFPPFLFKFIEHAKKNGVMFIIAGGFPSFVCNKLNTFGDIDIYVNSFVEGEGGYAEKLIGDNIFQGHYTRIESAYEEAIAGTMSAHKVDDDLMEIDAVVTVCSTYKSSNPYLNEKYCSIDIIFAPKTCLDFRLYSLYIMNCFDISATRTSIFNIESKVSSKWSLMQISTPSYEKLREIRAEKYKIRSGNIEPSSLFLLSFNKLLQTNQLEYDFADI